MTSILTLSIFLPNSCFTWKWSVAHITFGNMIFDTILYVSHMSKETILTFFLPQEEWRRNNPWVSAFFLTEGHRQYFVFRSRQERIRTYCEQTWMHKPHLSADTQAEVFLIWRQMSQIHVQLLSGICGIVRPHPWMSCLAFSNPPGYYIQSPERFLSQQR